MSSKFIQIFLMIFFLILPNCSSSSNTNTSQTSGEPAGDSVEITPNPANLVAGGEFLQLTAVIIKGSGAVITDADFVWETDDASIVSVDQAGKATGIKVGVSRITARTTTTTAPGSLTASTTIGVVSANLGASNLTLSGTASYENKVFDKTGFTGTIENKPIRNTVIEVVAIDGFVTIATGATDDSGVFNLTADNAGKRGGVYLRVISTIDPANISKLEIRNNSSGKALLAFTSSGIDDSLSDPFTANQDLLATTTGIGGAFNILDALLTASAFVRDAGPCLLPNPNCNLPLLTTYWEPGGTAGTFFQTPPNAIFICGGGASDDCNLNDKDEYDDSVILHEFGHFVLHQFSDDDSPGGLHALQENDQDIRLSWSEGWANFFSSAVRESPIYVDTAAGGLLISFDIEDYSIFPASSSVTLARYTTSEFAVAGVLWDIADQVDVADVNENDPIALSFKKILETLENILLTSPRADMETFWLAFQSGISTSPSASALQTVMKGRMIELEQDPTEGGSETALSVGGGTQHHTLYLDTLNHDEDIIPFTVNTGIDYTVRTFNLTNGADTILTIKDNNGVIVVENGITQENDNPNDADFSACAQTSTCPSNGLTTLSSSVSFRWTGTNPTTLNAHIKSSPIVPPSAGLFGSYDIDLTSP